MTIETKYNIGDEVWFICSNLVQTSTVRKIRPIINRDNNLIYYYVDGLPYEYSETKLFPTKAELLKSL